jgi:hypothetical protein
MTHFRKRLGGEIIDEIIDILHEPERGKTRKPRTYRERARKAYLAVAKQRRYGLSCVHACVNVRFRLLPFPSSSTAMHNVAASPSSRWGCFLV